MIKLYIVVDGGFCSASDWGSIKFSISSPYEGICAVILGRTYDSEAVANQNDNLLEVNMQQG